MRVGIIQSNYIPWLGYFDFIDSVDLFIIHDDLQYTKGDWRNRNKIKTENGLAWLSVPVKYHETSQLIYETLIDYSHKWQSAHINKFKANYLKAAFFKSAIDLLENGLAPKDQTISQLNVRLIKLICTYLDITTPIKMSKQYAVKGTKTERLINLLKKVGAKTYLSGPTAKDYLDVNLFMQNGLKLEYKTYDYKPYQQLWGEFERAVTVLDLIANTGQEARKYLKSMSPNIVAIE